MKTYKCRLFCVDDERNRQWLDVPECSTPEDAAADYAESENLQTGDFVEVQCNGLYMISSVSGYQAAKMSR